MLTRRQLILAKIKYLCGDLPDKQINIILKLVRNGTKKEFIDILDRLKIKRKNNFKPIVDILSRKNITNNTSLEELQNLVEEISVKSMSVDGGLKILKNAQKLNNSKKKLLSYIYNLFLKDRISKKAMEGPAAILEREPAFSPLREGEPSPFPAYFNPAQENYPGRIPVYDENDEYLAVEKQLDTHPTINDKHKELKKKKKIRMYIPELLGIDTPGLPNNQVGKT